VTSATIDRCGRIGLPALSLSMRRETPPTALPGFSFRLAAIVGARCATSIACVRELTIARTSDVEDST
jgi:hypothetical protein